MPSKKQLQSEIDSIRKEAAEMNDQGWLKIAMRDKEFKKLEEENKELKEQIEKLKKDLNHEKFETLHETMMSECIETVVRHFGGQTLHYCEQVWDEKLDNLNLPEEAGGGGPMAGWERTDG